MRESEAATMNQRLISQEYRHYNTFTRNRQSQHTSHVPSTHAHTQEKLKGGSAAMGRVTRGRYAAKKNCLRATRIKPPRLHKRSHVDVKLLTSPVSGCAASLIGYTYQEHIHISHRFLTHTDTPRHAQTHSDAKTGSATQATQLRVRRHATRNTRRNHNHCRARGRG